MPEIYTNFPFESPEFDEKNFIKSFEDYVEHLEKTAKTYKNFIKFVKTKKIKVSKTKGFPYAGSFSVDEIDAGRLKKANLVMDLNETGEQVENSPPFYIDEDLDDALVELDKSTNDLPDFQEILIHGRPPSIEININEDDIEEKSSLLNLRDVIKETTFPTFKNDPNDFSPGTLMVDVNKVGDHQYTFNLTIADLNDDPLEIKFNREKGQFEYKCGACENIHTESLSSVFGSLKTTSALLSNLIAMIQTPKELGIALEFIDHDLRLLQSLIAFDYALDENEGVISDEEDDSDEEEKNTAED